MKPRIIRQYKMVKIKDLEFGMVFQPSFDCFTHFHETRREYLIERTDTYAVSQIISKYNGEWVNNIKCKYDNLDKEMYLLTGEKIFKW